MSESDIAFFAAIIAKLSAKLVKNVANKLSSSAGISSLINIASELLNPIKLLLEKLFKFILTPSPKELIDKSELDVNSKIMLVLEGIDIAIYPYEEDWDNFKVIATRSLDEKGRIAIPKNLNILPEELLVYIENGVIKMRRGL